MKLSLRYYGDPILRSKATPVLEITPEIRRLAHEMVEVMDASHGIGLGAPQIGHSIRLFVLRRYLLQSDGSYAFSEPYFYVNPEIIESSEETYEETEGCLSIPGLWLPVVRPLKIKVRARDLEGNEVIHELEGMNGRVIFHENDHLNGVLFIDRVDSRLRKEAQGELQKIKKKYFR